MSSKEEIINDKINFLLPDIATVRMAIRESMDQYAKQQSVAFAEWVVINGWYFNKINRWSNRNESSDNLIEVLSATKSTEELYSLYLTQ